MLEEVREIAGQILSIEVIGATEQDCLSEAEAEAQRRGFPRRLGLVALPRPDPGVRRLLHFGRELPTWQRKPDVDRARGLQA